MNKEKEQDIYKIRRYLIVLLSISGQFSDAQKNEDEEKILISEISKQTIGNAKNEGTMMDAGKLILLVLIFVLLYGGYRSRKFKNKKILFKQQQIDQQKELLQKLLNEKEWLVGEMHHRVKNNLQIVISLLNSQLAYLENKDAYMAIQNSQHRIHAISLIHQKLYLSESLAVVNISWYINELVNYLSDNIDVERKINFDIDTDRFEFDVEIAVPLALILNEAISNSVKHAFNGIDNPEIRISLQRTKKESYELTVTDNGIGLPNDFDIDNVNSLGMNLMTGLSTQIDGTFTVQNDNGLTVTVLFRGLQENNKLVQQ
ncbi:hypothetical protein GR160_04840 [Flavobacterium sp. Sd200]|uniref:sensor histidine kinase n=1 Tax=Flavobacterium sp. Sd200 TaxID=2692211 RepID=UPI0013713584|nr:sensor histidine kinase [Flavobacterium sp. Sd200]MXN90543.1 hypothetical protein [Flavobacterium sp. Sd200]